MDHTCKQDEIVAHLGNESLQCTSVLMLHSHCWVNNEVVNFRIQMLEIQQVTKDNNMLIMQPFFMPEALIGAEGSLGRAKGQKADWKRWEHLHIQQDSGTYQYKENSLCLCRC